MGNDCRLVRERLVGRKVTREKSPIGVREWNLLVDVGALNNLAPFHVVKEESLSSVGVVEVTERDRAADVEAKHV